MKNHSDGMVLIVSLFLLLVITTLAASLFSSITMQTKMAGNFSAHSSAFEAANSAIENQWPDLPVAAAGETITEERVRTLPDTFDFAAHGVDYDATVTICYLGATQALGSDLKFDAHLFRMRAAVSETNGVRSQLQQSGYFLAEDSPIVLPPSC